MKYSIPPFVLLTALAPFIAHSSVITTADGEGADTFVEFASDSVDNFGGDQFVRVRLHPDGSVDDNDRFTRRTIIRFDTSSVTEAPGVGNAGDVSLQFTFQNTYDPLGNLDFPDATLPVTFNLYGLTDGVAQDASPGTTGWVESTVTGDTAPGGSSPTSFNSNVTGVLDSVTISSPASIDDTIVFSSVELTNFLLSDTNDLVTFFLYTDDATIGGFPIAGFWSKEGTGTEPTLSIVPEPGVYAALMGALVGVLALRRRR